MLLKELEHGSIKWVANHQINAAMSLYRLGLSPTKIIAYDWEHTSTPESWKKDVPSDIQHKCINIFYAGTISIKKGVLDLIKAVKLVKKSGRPVQVSLAGKIIDCAISNYMVENPDENINFLGLIDHDEVLSRMNCADIVVVPSHHSYPEGLPMTIMESLMVHTPVIASDHPMFVGRVGKRGSVRFFQEKSPSDLAHQIISVFSTYHVYYEMCNNAPLEWQDLCLPLKWADMVNLWISDPRGADFSPHSIKNLQYN